MSGYFVYTLGFTPQLETNSTECAVQYVVCFTYSTNSFRIVLPSESIPDVYKVWLFSCIASHTRYKKALTRNRERACIR